MNIFYSTESFYKLSVLTSGCYFSKIYNFSESESSVWNCIVCRLMTEEALLSLFTRINLYKSAKSVSDNYLTVNIYFSLSWSA